MDRLLLVAAFAAIGALGAVPAATAATIVIGNVPWRIILAIGSNAGTINVGSFSVPAANVGDSTPIRQHFGDAGQPELPGQQRTRRPAARSQAFMPRTVTLCVDSSAPLTAGGGLPTLPFTQFAWTSTTPGAGCLAAPVTIPSLPFSGGPGQPLITFNTSRRACV